MIPNNKINNKIFVYIPNTYLHHSLWVGKDSSSNLESVFCSWNLQKFIFKSEFCTNPNLLILHELYTIWIWPDFCTDEICKRIFTENKVDNADIIFVDVVDRITIDLSIDLIVFFSLNKGTFVLDRIDVRTHHDIQNRLRLRNQRNLALIPPDAADK